MTIKYMRFVHRFQRTNYKYILVKCIGYWDNDNMAKANRHNLPSIFHYSGHILWFKEKENIHNPNGPSQTSIDGTMRYFIHDRKVGLLEWSMCSPNGPSNK